MKEEDYPFLYVVANKASLKAQFYYVSGIRIYLILTFLGSIINFLTPFYGYYIQWFSTLFFLLSLIILVIQSFYRFDEIWYSGRAVAESVKTRTWRYIMNAEPYNVEKTGFLQDLKDILSNNQVLAKNFNIDFGLGVFKIKMEEIRKISWNDRLEYYLKHRIDEQRTWYAKKASLNKNRANRWFLIMIMSNVLALIISFYFNIKNDNYSFSTEPLIVLGSVALSWMQSKRFREFGNAYALTVHEISLIREESAFVKSEQELSNFIKDAENAFSREHTQWVARKDK
jgi:hypothetical protein